MKSKYLCGALAVSAGILSPLAGAAEPAAGANKTISESDYFNELPVVLTVSRLAQSLKDTPAAVTVIDRDMIRFSGAREVWELLRLVPGFQVAPVVGGQPVATYHGLTEEFPRRVQVLVDGRSQYSAVTLGGVNWNMIPVSLDDIERIEVIRGSNSAAYGSNAFLGVVNIITRSAADSAGFNVAGNNGGQGVRDSRVRWAGRIGEHALRITLEENRDQGLDNQVDDRQTRRLDLRGDFRLGVRDELQLQAGRTELERAAGVVGSASNPERSQYNENSYLQAVWRRTLDDTSDLSLRYEHAEELSRDPRRVITRVSGVPVTADIDSDYRAWRDGIELQHTIGWNEAVRLVSGVGYRGDQVSSKTFFGRSGAESLRVLRAFGNLEWRGSPQWLVNFGGTWENDSVAGTTFSPRLGANYRLADEHTLRAVGARAHRTASLFEARGNWANQSLPISLRPPAFPIRLDIPNGIILHQYVNRGAPKPEQLDAFELGYLGDWRAAALRLDVRAFSEHVKDRVFWVQFPLSGANCNQPVNLVGCGSADAATNLQDDVMHGVEYQLEWRPRESTRVLLNQSFVKVRSSLHGVPAGMPSSNQESIVRHADHSAPTHTTSLMLMQRLPLNVELGIAFHSVGSIQWSNSADDRANAYHRLDWRVAHAFHLGSKSGELAYTRQSDSPAHGEKSIGQLVTPRDFVTLRLDL